MIKTVVYSGLFLIVTFTACQKRNLKNAEKSLIGSWGGHSINSSYGTKMDLGLQTNEDFNETGALGEFVFRNEVVDYQFIRLDTLYENQSTYNLLRQKVNVGFTKAERYTLTVDGFDFICAFGDQTSDAEKQATEISLFFETKATGSYYAFKLNLRKN